MLYETKCLNTNVLYYMLNWFTAWRYLVFGRNT